MNEVVLPPSPNWYLSSILACANNGTIAWGARNAIVIAQQKENSKSLTYSIIEKAHYNRVTSVAFSPKCDEDGSYDLVSAGDDNTVKIWSLKDLNVKLKNTSVDAASKVIGIDWSKCNSNRICFVSDNAVLVSWNIDSDTSRMLPLGKNVHPTYIACCPHDGNGVAVGLKSGLIYIVDIRKSGEIIYKLRGHDVEIVSLSWCPVPNNIFEDKETNDFLIASGAKDRSIFLWKAGSDGRYQIQIALPITPLESNSHKGKVSASAGNYTAVCWLEPKILLTSSPWGELLMWDLTGNTKTKFTPKLINSKHSKGLFAIAGLADKSSQQLEDTENDNWRKTINIKSIWTVGQDRQIICSSLIESEPTIEYILSTQGGYVYCLGACPVDTSQIAFGVGDAMIRLWNLSEPHDSIIEPQVLWEKIKGKVRAISWHPEKENLLAFATNEGRVGVFDTNKKKPPILYRQYHRNTVYSIGWGPAPNIKEYALFTCGDGELVYYNPEKVNENPISCLKSRKDCVEFCWKPDYSLVALGFQDGAMKFLNRDLSEFRQTIHILNKTINCLAWHPESTSSDLNISAMQNYIAVGVNHSTIKVLDISSTNNSDETSFYKTVATLNGHSTAIFALAWSPHMSGYLVSGGCDHTAQVWKIETQELIATYSSHSGPIRCCMWSPLSQDLILTGSDDFTLRIWSISSQNVLPLSPAKSTIKHRTTKKKKSKETTISNNTIKETETGLVEDKKDVKYQKPSTGKTEDINKNVHKVTKKKKQKTHFPVFAEITNDNKLWCSQVKSLLNSLKNNSHDNEQNVLNWNGIENHSNEKVDSTEETNPFLLGDTKNFEDGLNYEKVALHTSGHCNAAAEIDLWTGNLEQNLRQAMKKKILNDYLVSLAPAVSIELWELLCKVYADQIFEENPHKAASYLLCINKVHEALDIFTNAKLYKEAYVLASSKLNSGDIIIKKILEEWANSAQKDGHFQNAALCYIKLGEYAKAAKMLERRKDIDSLILAIDLAELAEDSELCSTLGDKAILESLFESNFVTANSIIKKYPQLQYREVEVEIFSKLNEILICVTDQTIFNWLKGSSSVALLESLNKNFTKCPKKYSLLLQKGVISVPVSQKMIQISVSHHLALSVLSDQQKQQLWHIVKALDIVFQNQKIDSVIEKDKFPLIMKYIYALDGKNLVDTNSIFNGDKSGLAVSIRAYFCNAIVNWSLESKLNEEQIDECNNLVSVVLEKYIDDLLNKESVKFCLTSNEITKLEVELSSLIGKFKDGEDDIDGTKSVIERLDKLRNEKKQFVDDRVSAPNPLFSYGAVMEFISKITNEETRDKYTKLVMDKWKNVIT